MDIFTTDIKKATLENSFFRRVLFTGNNAQIVVMSLKPGEEIGEEIHDLDQILYFVQGSGKAVLNDQEYKVAENAVVYVPKGVKHNFINTGSSDMKLHTVYAPSEHLDGTIHKTKEEADAAEEAEKAIDLM